MTCAKGLHFSAFHFVKQQDNEMKRAVCRVGDLRLHASYSYLEKNEDKWLQMDVTDRQSHFRRVMKVPLKSSEQCDTYTPSDLPEIDSLASKGITL